jgi:peptide subunit release factor 1 (eRF1)
MEQHLRRVVDELKKLAEAYPIKLAVGGTDETVNELLKLLPESLARNFVGRFPVDYKHDTEKEILERARAVLKTQEHFDENKLVDQIFDAAKSKKQGVLGVKPTLGALAQEKVRTLVVADGFAISGSVCRRCDYFAQQQFDTCPVCGGEAEYRDIADRTIEKAILTGAEAEIVSSSKARDRLFAEGGLGALLRY